MMALRIFFLHIVQHYSVVDGATVAVSRERKFKKMIFVFSLFLADKLKFF